VTARLLSSFSLLATLNLLSGANAYLQHNLVSDLPDTAGVVDPNLVNPRGIAYSAAGPFWVTNDANGRATVYNGSGAASSTVVSVPLHPTGIVFNTTTDFALAAGQPATFLFCTEDGTISGWNATVDARNAVAQVDHSSSGAVYTGLARATNGAGSALYAANFSAGTIEVYDGNFHVFPAAGAFQDPMIPAGFAPFNIQAFGNRLFVTFALQDAAKKKDVPGAGNGYVDVFDVNGSLVQRVAAGGILNSPWGLAIAPSGFGDLAGALLVANAGDGMINAYNMVTGGLLGAVQDVSGNNLVIPGLWGLATGNSGSGGDAGAIYFTAGIAGGGALHTHGLFGSLQAAPLILPNGIVNGASFQLGIAPYTFVSILGTNLSATTRSWQDSDFVNGRLPTSLDGVAVTVDGMPAYPAYISPRQLNVLMPTRLISGQVQVMSNGLASSVMPAQLTPVAPAFFLFGASGYAAATHADGTSVGNGPLFPTSSKPAKPGEMIMFYGTGFGPTTPPVVDGALVSGALPLALPFSITVGGLVAQTTFAGLSATGLYQFNVVIPDMPSGEVPVIGQIAGSSTRAALVIVQNPMNQ
jgi:uncharacterized protein (TIGR03118 family)